MICTRPFFTTSTWFTWIALNTQERLGSSIFKLHRKKKTFQVMFTLTDTVQEVHERQARHSIKAQKIPRSSDETCMIKDLLQPYKLSSLIWWVRCCHRGTTLSVKSSQKKEKKLWSHFLQHSHSQCKQTSKLFHSLPFSHRLSWHHCFEIMPEMKKDTHCYVVCTFYMSTPSVYEPGTNINEGCNCHYQFFKLSFIYRWYIYIYTVLQNQTWKPCF